MRILHFVPTLCRLSFVVLGLLLVPGLASAQSEDVKEIVEQAERDVRERNYPSAVDGYIEAYEASGSHVYLYNISLLYLVRLGDPLNAWQYGVRFQAAAKTDGERTDAEDLIAMATKRLKATHTPVELVVTPADARVFVDKKTPDALVVGDSEWVLPGEHRVLADSPGHESTEQWFEATLGVPVTLEVHLNPIDAVLAVGTSVANGVVFLDSVREGEAPVKKSLKPGSYLVRVEAEGHDPFEKRVILKPGETRILSADLKPVPEKAVKVVTRKPPPKMPVPEKPIRMDPMEPLVTETPEKAGYDRTWAWVSFGGSGAMVVAGTVLYAVGYMDASRSGMSRDDYPNNPSFDEAWEARGSKGRKEIYAGYALWGVGAAALGVGLYLYFTTDVEEQALLIPSGPGGPGLTASIPW